MSTLLETIEIETAPEPSATVIWLHGLGADGNDFAPLVPELASAEAPAMRFVFPHAPLRPISINRGYVMRGWYDITLDDLSGRSRGSDAAGIRASQAQIEALIARENARGVASRDIVLAGFSQGGAIALHTGLRYPERLAGILALSTYLPLAEQVAVEAATQNQDVPIFFAHGSEDTVIVPALGLRSRDALGILGYAVEWHEYRMSHSVCAGEISDIRHWLARVLG
jgi:phospholipase/carboxylesterase